MITYRLSKEMFNQENTASRVIVIDKTAIIAFAINKLLTNHPYINVVGQCTDAHDALTLCKKLSPTLVIIDPDLASISCSELITQLQRYNPELKFIIFFHENSQFRFDEYISLGIQGLVLKHTHPNTLLSAIQTVSRGGTFMDTLLTPASAKANHNQGAMGINFTANPLSVPKISSREKQILTLVSRGLKTREIASKLAISSKTVESHRLNLRKKLGANNIAELIKWANRLNIS